VKKALVTGGAGFIGSNLCLELERLGWRVVALDDFSSGHFENLRGFRGDVVAADVVCRADWEGRVGPVDAVFHEAAITDTTVSDQHRMMRVNVEGFRSVLEFAKRVRAKSVVYASSAAVYGPGPCPMRESQEPNPLNVYGFSKEVMDRVGASFAVGNRAIKVTGLRYFNVFGPRERHKGKVASMIWQLHLQMEAGRRPRIFKMGEQARDHIYVKDIVAANLRALAARTSGVYNACTGKAVDFNAVVKALNGTMGTSLEPEYFDNPYGFYQNHTQGDPAAARKALGFAAKWSVEAGVKDYLGDGA
jgi:ADP-L-glycero-D-manno-heptose 6-epimerase